MHILPTMQFNHQQFASDIQVCYASNGKYSLSRDDVNHILCRSVDSEQTLMCKISTPKCLKVHNVRYKVTFCAKLNIKRLRLIISREKNTIFGPERCCYTCIPGRRIELHCTEGYSVVTLPLHLVLWIKIHQITRVCNIQLFR